MTRKLYRWRDGKFEEVGADYTGEAKPRVHVISDDLGKETWNPVDGKHYTSKSALRRVAKERGLIEVGNDEIKPREPEYVSIKEEYLKAEAEVLSRRRR